MKRTCIFLLLDLPTIIFLFAAPIDAGDKATTWKPFLPDDAYKTLTERSIKAIEAEAKGDGKTAAEKIQLEGAILFATTLSVKNSADDSAAVLRGAALNAARAAEQKKTQSLSNFANTTKMALPVKADTQLLKPFLPSIDELMVVFRNKSKGGEGLHDDLQYHPKLKKLNGIEAFIGALASKKLSEENLDKIASELPALAYRVAVIGALTHEMSPIKNADKWRELATQMRDASIALAESGRKKNADGILKSAVALETSCTQCHMAFKK